MADIVKIHALIIGGGLAGFATAIALLRSGHKVTLLEGSSRFSETGAGIQVPPNCSRILANWNLLAQIRSCATEPDSINIRSYVDGEILSKTNLRHADSTESHQPHLVLHRADFLNVLVQEAQRLDADLLLGKLVEYVDFRVPFARTKDGEIFKADLIIGADGERSVCRSMLLKKDDPPMRSGKIVSRFTVPTAVVRQQKELASLVSPASVSCWIGPASHAICYEISNHNALNVVLVRPHTEARASTPAPASQMTDLNELRAFFASWDPSLRKLLDLADNLKSWPLVSYQTTDIWTHQDGKFILIGDAAHCIQPHLVQGASQAVEDAACLGGLLSKVRSKKQIWDFLTIYCDLRKPRISDIAVRSKRVGDLWHYEDGQLQIERNRQMRSGRSFPGFPNPFSDESLLQMIYDYSVTEDALAALKRYERGEWPGTLGCNFEDRRDKLAPKTMKRKAEEMD